MLPVSPRKIHHLLTYFGVPHIHIPEESDCEPDVRQVKARVGLPLAEPPPIIVTDKFIRHTAMAASDRVHAKKFGRPLGYYDMPAERQISEEKDSAPPPIPQVTNSPGVSPNTAAERPDIPRGVVARVCRLFKNPFSI